MSPDELRARNQLRADIRAAVLSQDQLAQRLAELPISVVTSSATLCAAWAMVNARSEPTKAMQALVRAARLIELSGQQRAHEAGATGRLRASAGKAKAQAAWDMKYGPGFDLYAEIQRAGEGIGLFMGYNVGIPNDETDDRFLMPSAQQMRQITGVVKAVLATKYPERWAAGASLRIDKSSFRAAFSSPSRIIADEFDVLDDRG
jgi:hypothetical protein